MNSLSKKELSTAYNILTDLEFYMTWQDADKELIQNLNKKFYRCIPHKETPNLTLIQIYSKKAIIIGKIKNLSWTKN